MLFIFEVMDKMPAREHLWYFYLFFAIPGFLLGLRYRWPGLLMLIPIFFIALELFIEINHPDIGRHIRSEDPTYVAHAYFATIFSCLLVASGLFVNLAKRRTKLK